MFPRPTGMGLPGQMDAPTDVGGSAWLSPGGPNGPAPLNVAGAILSSVEEPMDPLVAGPCITP